MFPVRIILRPWLYTLTLLKSLVVEIQIHFEKEKNYSCQNIVVYCCISKSFQATGINLSVVSVQIGGVHRHPRNIKLSEIDNFNSPSANETWMKKKYFFLSKYLTIR